MTWYEDAGFKGRSLDIYGNRGTCDRAGYTFRPFKKRFRWYSVTETWGTHLSSIKGYGQCNTVRITDLDNADETTLRLPATFGASKYNDNVGIVQVYHR